MDCQCESLPVVQLSPDVASALAPTSAQAVTRRLDARRATLQPATQPSPGAPASPVCDGWGLVPVLGLDGEYEPAACLGCALCSTVREPAPARDPFARLPVPMNEDEF